MSKNCVEIIRPFVDAIDDSHRVQLMGGVGAYVLQQDGAEILPEERVVVAPPGFDPDGIGQFRPDGNRRDVDILVKTADPAIIKTVEEMAEDAIGDELEISVFGLKSIKHLLKQQALPDISTAIRWVSDRYVREEEGEITEAKKALFPFAVDMDLASLETWHAIIKGNKPVPIPHPATVILNYVSRSISGLRPKDSDPNNGDKVNSLARVVFDKAPEMIDWITDGPGQSQLDLARILHSLREPEEAQTLTVGERLEIRPYELEELVWHPAMLMRNEFAARRAIKWACRKAKALHFFESDRTVVTLYQKYLEGPLGFITHNR